MRGPMTIYGVLYRKYLWEPNIMENIWVMCEKYLCGLRIMCGLMWVFFVSGLMKLRPENLYLNTNCPLALLLSLGRRDPWSWPTFPCLNWANLSSNWTPRSSAPLHNKFYKTYCTFITITKWLSIPMLRVDLRSVIS